MNIQIIGADDQMLQGLSELQEEYGFIICDEAETKVICDQQDHHAELKIVYKDGTAHISFKERIHFFRGFSLMLEKLSKGENVLVITEEPQFQSIGPMFDLSRNAVIKPEVMKEFIRKLAMMGLNTALLYMEDTYEIKNEPYFGYMRGRYSQAELKLMDDYATLFGIELIPCIQTLAHLEEFLKWDAAYSYKDTRGTLLLEEDKTYDLLENMIRSVTEAFRSKRIHLGMDEAEEVGRGRYLNLYGHKSRFELMVGHLKKVLAIVDHLGLEGMIWSDMFLKLASNTGDNYHMSTEMPTYMIEQMPKNVKLVYWQYNETNQIHYEQMFNLHARINQIPAFAGGMWIWNTFAPNYKLSLAASSAALAACKTHGVKEVFVTLWGDDGFESNIYNALLGLQFYAEHAYQQIVDETKLKERVQFCTGIQAEKFHLLNQLDMPPGVHEGNLEQTNPSKFLLWQDVLLGLFDKHVEAVELEKVEKYYSELQQKFHHARCSALNDLFSVPEHLSNVLAIKSTLGVKLKAAYDQKDFATLEEMVTVHLPDLINRVSLLCKAHRNQWMAINKSFGWEVIDIRYGGLLQRLRTAIVRVKAYVNQEINTIDELEAERLYFSPKVEDAAHLGWCSYYYRIASPNVFFHVLPIY